MRKDLDMMHALLPGPEGFFDRALILFPVVKHLDDLSPFVLVRVWFFKKCAGKFFHRLCDIAGGTYDRANAVFQHFDREYFKTIAAV